MRRAAKVAIVSAVVLLTALVLAEAVARSVLADEAEARLRDGGISGDVEVSVGRPWRPSLLGAFVTGELDRVEVALRSGSVSGIDVDSADYRLEGLRVSASLRDRTIGATGLSSGSVRIVVDAAVADPTELAGGDPWFLPCRPAVERRGGTVVLACVGDDLPGVLRTPLGPAIAPSEPTGPDPAVQLQPPQTLELDPSSEPGGAGG